jgi:hypothetical protein
VSLNALKQSRLPLHAGLGTYCVMEVSWQHYHTVHVSPAADITAPQVSLISDISDVENPLPLLEPNQLLPSPRLHTRYCHLGSHKQTRSLHTHYPITTHSLHAQYSALITAEVTSAIAACRQCTQETKEERIYVMISYNMLILVCNILL